LRRRITSTNSVEFPWRRSRRILSTVFRRSYRKKSTYLNAVLFLHSLRRSAITLNCNSSTCILVIAWSTNGNVCTDRLQSDRPSRDVFPSCFSEIDRLINQAVIRRVTFAVEKLSLGGRRNSATCRRISRIILASVLNASRRRRRGLAGSA